MTRTRSSTAAVCVVGVVGAYALTACGGVVPGFYSEAGEREALVADCVEYIQIAAFSGDAAARQVWDETGQDADVLTQACDGLADTDPDRLESYRRQLRSVERQVRAAADEQRDHVIEATTGDACNANYRGRCLPLDEDVDCLPSDGDGPWFIDATVVVMGEDVFELDDDGDGLGCDPEETLDV